MATTIVEAPVTGDNSRSAMVWGPIWGGAFAAVVATAVLMLLGSGLGLTLISPWSGQSAGLTTIAASTAIWIVVVQWLSSALGGYLAGRLRTKWVGVHTEEVFFRDTAHGFMAWALATLIVIAVVGLHSTVLFGAGAYATANVAGGAVSAAARDTQTNSQQATIGYLTDSLLRPADPSRLAVPGAEADQAAVLQAGRILAFGAIEGEVTQEDRVYLAMLVAARTGLSLQDAQVRVATVISKADELRAKAQQAIDDARHASAIAAILGALSMVIGAFIAAVAGAIGGGQRDENELAVSVSP